MEWVADVPPFLVALRSSRGDGYQVMKTEVWCGGAGGKGWD